jgi:phage gp29-like protein
MNFVGSLAELAMRAASGLTSSIGLTKPLPLFMGAGRIGGDLTPKQVGRIIIGADTGFLYRIVDLFDESRQKDCHLHAVLSTLEQSIAGMTLQVIPASTKRRDMKIAAWVEQWLSEFGSRHDGSQARGLEGLVEHMVSGYIYSHAVSEILWEKRGMELIPIGAENVHARRFIYDMATCELRFWDAGGTVPLPGVQLRRAFPNHYIEFMPRVTGAIIPREGLMRPLLWAALFRNWAIRDWLTLAELAWKPWRIGYYDKEKYASEWDIAWLDEALAKLTSTGYTRLPKNVELKIEWPKATGSTNSNQHALLASFMADEMSKAVLGATLTAQQGARGAFALGAVHDSVRRDRRDATARCIADILRRQLVGTAVRLNYGADAAVPGLRFVSNTDTNIDAIVSAVQKLADPKIGLPFPIQWLYKLLSVPAPKPGEQVIGNPNLLRIPTEEEQKKIRVVLVNEDDRQRAAEEEAEAIEQALREARAADALRRHASMEDR